MPSAAVPGPPPQERPADDVVEVTLLGNGLGESACVHLGGQRWLIVDSMIDRPGDPPAALTYLEGFGYDNLAEHVAGMVVTHWHDDHTRGFRQLNVALPTVPLWISAALDPRQFLLRARAVATDPPDPSEHGGEAPAGIQGLFALLAKPPKGHDPLLIANLRYASSGKTITGWPASSDRPECHVTSVSPADTTTGEMQAKFSDWLALRLAADEAAGLPHVEQNHLSVAVHIQVGDVHILLGSDLETRSERGWQAVADDLAEGFHPPSVQPSSLYKIAHHGSKTAHDAQLIPTPTALLVEGAHGVLAPFRNGASNVPSPEEAAALAVGLGSVWTTSPDPATQQTPADGRILNALTLRGFNPKRRTRDMGTLRARRPATPGPDDDDWDIQTFGAGIRLSP